MDAGFQKEGVARFGRLLGLLCVLRVVAEIDRLVGTTAASERRVVGLVVTAQAIVWIERCALRVGGRGPWRGR